MPARRARLHRALLVASALLLALLATAAWQLARHYQPDVRIELADVQTIRIERADQSALLLRNDGNHWQLQQPYSLPANPQRIEPLLAALTAGGDGYPPDQVDLEGAGLDTPAAVLRIDDTRIAIGAADTTGSRRYAQRNGRVVLIDDWLLSLIDGGVSALARLTPFDDDLAAIDTASPRSHVTLADWQALAARQIVAWPIMQEPAGPQPPGAQEVGASNADPAAANLAGADMSATGSPVRLSARLTDGGMRSYEVHQTPRYTALHPVDSGFAYVFANEDWPCPNSPKSKPPAAASNPGC